MWDRQLYTVILITHTIYMGVDSSNSGQHAIKSLVQEQISVHILTATKQVQHSFSRRRRDCHRSDLQTETKQIE